MISVVIPAHNEATVIGRCLEALLAGARPDQLDVVVVCNGCTDRTPDVAAAVAPSVRVMEVPTPSKVAALQLGDELAKSFPRIYMDADITLSNGGVQALARALEEGPHLAASPTLRLDTSRSSWAVRSYFRIWTLLPSVMNGLAGRGVYAVSAEGRGRFDRWPRITADDHFVNSLFAPAERISVPSCSALVHAPRSFSSLLRRRARVHLGNKELTESSLQAPVVPATTDREWIGVVRRHRRRLPDLPVYVAVSLGARLIAARQRASGRTGGWSRDESSRRA